MARELNQQWVLRRERLARYKAAQVSPKGAPQQVKCPSCFQTFDGAGYEGDRVPGHGKSWAQCPGSYRKGD
jgi:hypothetical protein